jgi:cysteine dioxygenase
MIANPRPLPVALAPLLAYLNGLNERRADLGVLERLLRESRVAVADMEAYLQFDDRCYCRNLVAENPWFNLLVLCWRSGQSSPIHDHAQSVCAFKVLTGVCTETVYDLQPGGGVLPGRRRDYAMGEIVASHDSETHAVANFQPAGADLVTLHVYSPPLKAMRVFAPDGRAGGEWTAPERPINPGTVPC